MARSSTRGFESEIPMQSDCDIKKGKTSRRILTVVGVFLVLCAIDGVWYNGGTVVHLSNPASHSSSGVGYRSTYPSLPVSIST